VPTVWDETRVLKGEIGQLAVIARRRGAEWYVGCMNAEQARTITLPLDFLEAGREYTATVYSDDPTVRTRTQVAVTRRTVDADTVLTISLSLQGGQAMRILPREPQP
jgi:alpha-glucosidase